MTKKKFLNLQSQEEDEENVEKSKARKTQPETMKQDIQEDEVLSLVRLQIQTLTKSNPRLIITELSVSNVTTGQIFVEHILS